MRFLNAALAIKPNANEMNMQHKFYLYYTKIFFYRNWVFWGSYSNAVHFFSQNVLGFLVINQF